MRNARQAKLAQASSRLWLVGIFGLLLALPCAGQVPFTYEINNGAVTITGTQDYTWFSPLPMVIPSTINGLPVTSIGNWAFSWINLSTGQNSYKLTSVTIPDSVTNIGANAFFNSPVLTSVSLGEGAITISDGAFGRCPGLASVTLPNSLVRMGSGAFSACTSLATVTIPKSVTSVGDSPFAGCTSLAAIGVDELNAAYSSIDGVLFNKGLTTLIECPGAHNGSYLVPNGVNEIGTAAFSGCAGLTSVVIANGVRSLGSRSFEMCVSLAGISMPNSVTSIGDEAFAECSKLTGVTIPGSITNIGADAFVWCTSLTNATIPDSVVRLGYWAFAGCSNLATATIGRGVPEIGNQTFQFCTSLSSVAIPDSVTNIGTGAFQDCIGLASATIGSGVIQIWDWAFQGCTNLTAAYFNGDAPAVAGTAFLDTPLTAYYLPGTQGWGPTFAGRPTALWNPTIQTADPGFGVGPQGFGFNINGTTNIPIVVEACTSVAGTTWLPLLTTNLTDGLIHFNDPGWANLATRFYRVRWP